MNITTLIPNVGNKNVSLTSSQKKFVSISAHIEIYPTNHDGVFCGKPRLALCYWPYSNTIRLTLGDEDDLDLAKEYFVKDETEGRKIFHELLNYLKDYDGAIVNPDELYNKAITEELYPKFNGIEMKWEFM